MLEEQLITGFRKIFENPDRQPMVAISYEKDMVPLLSEPRKLMYMSHSGQSIPDTISKFKLPHNIDRMVIDVSCNPSHTAKVSDLGCINELLSGADKSISCVWGICTDINQEEPTIIRILMK